MYTEKGLGRVLAMLRVMPESERERLLNLIAKENAAFAKLIRARVYTFDDLANLNSREWQLLHSKIAERDLVLSLRKCKAETKETALAAVSKRRAEDIVEQIENGAKQTLSEVEAAKERILEIAKELEKEGKLILRKQKNEKMVA